MYINYFSVKLGKKNTNKTKQNPLLGNADKQQSLETGISNGQVQELRQVRQVMEETTLSKVRQEIPGDPGQELMLRTEMLRVP